MQFTETLQNKYLNPLFGNKINIDSDSDITATLDNLKKYFKLVYVICPVIVKPDNSWFDKYIDEKTINDIYNTCAVYKTKIEFINNKLFFEWCKTVDTKILEKFNQDNIDICMENHLVLPLLAFEHNKVISLIENYKYTTWLEEFKINYNLDRCLTTNNLKRFLDSSFPYFYYQENCKANQNHLIKTTYFPNYKVKAFANEYGNVLSKKSDAKFSRYSKELVEFPNGTNEISKDDINNIFMELQLENDKEVLYKLFINLMISPEYCHLIINNIEIWNIMKDYISSARPMIKYCLFYAFYSLYMQELKANKYITEDNKCILKLSQISNIPEYYENVYNMDSSYDYVIKCKDSKSYNEDFNIYGVSNVNLNKNMSFKCHDYNIKNNSTLFTLDEFKRNLNIFITGDDIDVLKYMDLETYSFTGSVISACCHNNVLLKTYQDDDYVKQFNTYINNYYQTSDIDVMISVKNPIDFDNRAREFTDMLLKGIAAQQDKLQMDEFKPTETQIIKSNYVIFNGSFVINKLIPFWKEKQVFITLDYVLANYNTKEFFKNFLSPFVKDSKDKYYENMFESKNKYLDAKRTHPQLFINEDFEHTKINFTDIKTFQKEANLAKEPYFEWLTNTRYQISHPRLKKTFDLFSLKNKTKISTVYNFHYGCVRGYYDGNDVNLLPSAVLSYFTYKTPDLRIFYGSNEPLKIINKYHERGYGVILNKCDYLKVIGYFKDNHRRKDIKVITGSTRRPNKYDMKCLYDKKTPHKNRINVYEYPRTKIIQEYNSSYFKNNFFYKNHEFENDLLDKYLMEYKFVDSDGNPKPFNHGLIEMTFKHFIKS